MTHITQSQLESYLWGAAVLLRGYNVANIVEQVFIDACQGLGWQFVPGPQLPRHAADVFVPCEPVSPTVHIDLIRFCRPANSANGRECSGTKLSGLIRVHSRDWRANLLPVAADRSSRNRDG